MKRKQEIEATKNDNPSLMVTDNAEPEEPEEPDMKNIDCVQFGKYRIKTWYHSPYPEGFQGLDTLHVCEWCLKYTASLQSLQHHQPSCQPKCPPGEIVYATETNKVFEVDGKFENKLYCQNLSLLSKLFLDRKSIFYDLDNFLFYVLTETERTRKSEIEHVVGYFSKEKISLEGYNLACIVILPPFQRRGYGRLLIEFSYELSKLQSTVGSPERPLSDLGQIGYRSFWQAVIIDTFRSNIGSHLSINELSALTGVRKEDLVSTLASMDFLRYWKGDLVLCVTEEMMDIYLAANNVKLGRSVIPSCIILQKHTAK
ncbi:acyl-CoA N-acyltransferase [Cladochytrium replicatum]|nr:acyl-CoA N-acyltransferase [Cladochytrium replicatum]